MIKYCLRCNSENITDELREVNTKDGYKELIVKRCHDKNCGTFSYEYNGDKIFRVPTSVFIQDKMASIKSQMIANQRESSILKY